MHYISDFLTQFRRDQTGAVTIDWVVLTALLVGFATASVVTIGGAANTAGTSVVNKITEETDGEE